MVYSVVKGRCHKKKKESGLHLSLIERLLPWRRRESYEEQETFHFHPKWGTGE